MSNVVAPLIHAAHSIEPLSEALLQRGWWLGAGVVSAVVLQGLHRCALTAAENDDMRAARVGRGMDETLQQSIRNDEIAWITADNLIHQQFLEQLGQLRLQLNRELFLGLYEVEAHYAHYRSGGFYRRHYDSFVGAKSRVISLVIYLNPEWLPGDAGELVLYQPETGLPMANVAPRFGDVAVFLSEEIEHEVLPCSTDRYSIAAWFRCNSSMNNLVDPPAPGARV